MERQPIGIQDRNISPSPVAMIETGRFETLDIEKIRKLWSKTYNANGKPDWSHLYPYYHPDVVFQDSIQRIEGIKAVSYTHLTLPTSDLV